jgi:pilus assembly protein TadC
VTVWFLWLAWTALVAAGGWTHRPAPVRVRAIAAERVHSRRSLERRRSQVSRFALPAWSWLARRRETRRRAEALAAELPEVVDLLVLAVSAGLTVPLSVAAVAARADGVLASELTRALGETRRGRRLADALEALPARLGDAVRPLTAALVASERYGAPIMAGLERLAGEVRRDRRRRAEEAARRVPVKLLFPLVTCTLPAFALLTVAPLIAGTLGSLRL